MRLSIIIPVYNRLDVTRQGLKALDDAIHHYKLSKGTAFDFRVVIVDDGSTDGTSEWVKENYPTIHLLKGGDLWWSGSINLGARYAVEQLGTDYVLLWNDDTTCDKGYFSELEKVMQREQYRSSILVSKILWQDSPDTLFNFGCYFDRRTGIKKLNGLNEKDKEAYQKIIPVDWSGGMGTVIPSQVLVEVNYFDAKNFPQYHGDSDFFLRARRLQYQAYAIPSLRIWNNRETSGIKKMRGLSDLKRALYTNRSNYNLRQNYVFTYRHSNNIRSWGFFLYSYVALIAKSFKRMLWS